MEESERNPLPLLTKKPWYEKGLRFRCTQCGKCCTGAGMVWLRESDSIDIARHLGMKKEEFLRRYTRQVGNRYALLDQPQSEDCIFLRDHSKCAIYTHRPKQCRTFPWWKENLQSKAAWQNAARECEGIDNNEAPVVSKEEIEKYLL